MASLKAPNRRTVPIPRSSTSYLASTPKTVLMFSTVRTSAGLPSAKTLCSCTSTTRSQYLAAMGRSWDTMTTARPLDLESSRTRSRTSNCMLMSRCRVGSSMSRISGDWAIALAMMALCLSPPLMVLIRRPAMPDIPVRAMASSTTSSSSVLEPLNGSWNGILPISTMSLTVNAKRISLDWGTTATLRAISPFFIPAMSSPSSRTRPASGDRFLLRFLSSVDFPQPFGPRIPRISPLPTEMLTPSSTFLSL